MPNHRKVSRAKNKQDVEEEIAETISGNFVNPNPTKRNLKIKQFPWTERQKEFFKIALDNDTQIVFVNGPAGSAKTLLAVYCGLQLLNRKIISDIMYIRSAVESSDSRLGYLPGNADEKLKFFYIPFLDKLDELLAETRVEKLEQENRISMFPVNFARGMNWNAKCIILDEAQNSTIKEITTVLTRLGKNSRCFILADPMQTDLKNNNIIGSFENMSELFSDEESLSHGIHTFSFTEEDIMRSELVKFLVKKLKHLKKDKKDQSIGFGVNK
tara:strand:+ start:1954 stop:2766 length:813 start_codon:yes stop_codon:yes gene_type:complete